jgi:hypothetical protein
VKGQELDDEKALHSNDGFGTRTCNARIRPPECAGRFPEDDFKGAEGMESNRHAAQAAAQMNLYGNI